MIDIEEAYSWLNQFEESPLGFASQGLIKKLQEAVNVRRYGEAWAIVDRLKHLARDSSDNMEIGEIYVACGWAAYKMGKCDEATGLLENALKHYASHPHQLAIVQWMSGAIHWSLLAEHDAGITAWNRAICGFDRLARSKALLSKQATWYQERWIKMNQALQDKIENE